MDETGADAWRDNVRCIVANHERPLLAYVAHLLRSPEGARDIVQEAFTRLCEPRHVDVALPEWLFVVCRNLAIDRLRKERRMSVLDEQVAPADPSIDPPMRLVRADESRRLVALLATLPPRQQEAVRLKFQQNLSYPQIAAVMETNANNVAVLIHTGLKTLRERMSD
jgi:RNA polymerase sigma factor (sigma-70 family)